MILSAKPIFRQMQIRGRYENTSEVIGILVVTDSETAPDILTSDTVSQIRDGLVSQGLEVSLSMPTDVDTLEKRRSNRGKKNNEHKWFHNYLAPIPEASLEFDGF